MSVITVKNLRKHFKILSHREGVSGMMKNSFLANYRLIKAVDNVPFDKPVEIAGHLGPNGAGKSTIIKMMTEIPKPTMSTLLVNGQVPYVYCTQKAQDIGPVFGQRTQFIERTFSDW